MADDSNLFAFYNTSFIKHLSIKRRVTEIKASVFKNESSNFDPLDRDWLDKLSKEIFLMKFKLCEYSAIEG